MIAYNDQKMTIKEQKVFSHFSTQSKHLKYPEDAISDACQFACQRADYNSFGKTYLPFHALCFNNNYGYANKTQHWNPKVSPSILLEIYGTRVLPPTGMWDSFPYSPSSN